MRAAWQVAYVAQEAVADAQRVVAAALQLLEEVLAVEVHQLLQVAEDDAALAPQVLRQVGALHLGEVVVDDVAQRAHVLPLRRHHLVYDVTQFTVEGEKEAEQRGHSRKLSTYQSVGMY